MPHSLVQNNRILLVDDHRPIHQDFRDILHCQEIVANDLRQFESSFFGDAVVTEKVLPQYELDSAYQGQEAYSKVQEALQRKCPYALIFMDVRMPPGWDGIETVKRIWELDREVQIVICTAYADYTWEEIFNLFGRSDSLVFLRKPFDHTEVRQLASALTTKWCYAAISRLKFEELESLVVQKNRELSKTVIQLQEALSNIKTLSGLIPICSVCKKVRNDEGFWHQVEDYVSAHTDATFSHGICPECIDKHYPAQAAELRKNAAM
jgi:CheY-like chemotaxis protein